MILTSNCTLPFKLEYLKRFNNGVDDTIIDGDQLTQITVSVDASSDPSFLMEPSQQLDVINIDNDLAQIIIDP